MRSLHVVRAAAVPALFAIAAAALGNGLTPQESLGKSIFFDANLSANANQSCASCHGPEAGWTGPDTSINEAGSVYEGSIPGAFGDRKPPSSAYATQSPILRLVMEKDGPLFIGGNFWDGRATGERLGSPAAEQAQGPFLNPVEQALPSAAAVVTKICASAYGGQFRLVCGNDACDADKVSAAYDCVGFAVAAYEGSPESNAFTSKYDAYLAGRAKLTKLEKQGLGLFTGKGKCAKCHVLGPANGKKDGQPLFTDFTFDNLGVPRNPQNPVYQSHPSWIDEGLGGFLASRLDYQEYAPDNLGKHKVPTVRNVDKRPVGLVKAYAHNGYFKSLEQIVHFYNTRDVKPVCRDDSSTPGVDESLFMKVEDAIASGCWPEPEVLINVNDDELGDLKLSPAQEAAIVAFMKALSDGYMP